MYKRRLIREQNAPNTNQNTNTPQNKEPLKEIPLDPLLQKAYEVVCFPGFGKIVDGYKGAAALGRWFDNTKSKFVFIQSSTEKPEANLFKVTEVNGADGTELAVYQQECSKITGNIFGKQMLRPDQQKIVDELKTRKFLTSDDKTGNITTHDWIDIRTDEDVKNLITNPKLLNSITDEKDFMMWKPKDFSGAKMGYEDPTKVANDWILYLTGKGWTTRPLQGQERNFIKCDLKNTSNQATEFGENCYKGTLSNSGDYAKFFQGKGYTLYMPKNFTQGAGEYDEFDYQTACKLAKSGGTGNNASGSGGAWDKNNCEKCIDSYYRATVAGANQSPDLGFPEIVNKCLATHSDNFPRYQKVIKFLRGDNLASSQMAWKIKNTSYKQKKGNIFGGQVTESEVRLKKTITESLQLVKERKRVLMIESTVVKDRINLIREGRNLKNKKSLKIFLNNFLNESAYLNTKFNQNVISEQFLDMLKGFFSGAGLDGILSFVKEYAAKWLLGKLGLSSNNWLGTIVTTTIGNIPIGDLTKITDCNFVVPILSKSIAESFAQKMVTTSKEGKENKLSGVIRNSAFEVLDDVPFIKSIEDGISQVLCPMWGQLTGKLSNVTNKLTQSADDAKPAAPSLMGLPSSLSSISSSLSSLIPSSAPVNEHRNRRRFR